MEIVEPRLALKACAAWPVRQEENAGGIKAAKTTKATQELISEHTLTLYINDRYSGEIHCTPVQLPELVLGRLLSGGTIFGEQDVARVEFAEDASRACVALRVAGDAAAPPPSPLTPIPFQQAWAASLSEALRGCLPLHRRTYGTHGCILMRDGEILQCCEDLGRHNAMDKALGWALRNGIPLHTSVLFTSCRIPEDMAWKAIRAGVPVLASKSLPTAQAVALAKQYRLTLMGHVYPDSMKIFTA